MRIGSFIVIILSLLGLIACLDELDLKTPKGTETGLVIQGDLIKADYSIVRIRIGRIFNFDARTLSSPELQSVKLIDEAGNEMELPNVRANIYEHIFDPIIDPIKVEYYQQYKTQILTTDGRLYESSFEELLPLPEGDVGLRGVDDKFVSINQRTNKVEEFPAIQFLTSTPLKLPNNENARLAWTAERTYQITDTTASQGYTSKTCYITSNLDFDNIHLLDGKELDLDEAIDLPISKVRISREFAEGYTYTILRKSLTQGAFDYWKQTKQAIERKGLLFEPTAGRILSNFNNVNNSQDNTVFGYFTAYTQDTTRIYIPPERYNIDKYCPLEGRRCIHICCDCLIEEGSTTIKPYFWEG